MSLQFPFVYYLKKHQFQQMQKKITKIQKT